MFKKAVLILAQIISALSLAQLLEAAGSSIPLTVSSGTYQTVDMYTNADGSNRQAIVIGDFTSSDTVRVDNITGMRVSLSTSALTTTTAIRVDGSATTQPISGTVTANISGSISNTGFNSTVVNIPTVTFNGIGQPVTSTYTVISTTYNITINEAQINGTNVSMGSGTNGTGVQRITMATDQIPYGINGTTVIVNQAGTSVVFISTFANVTASQTNQILVGVIASTKICVHQLSALAGGTATNLTFTSSGGSAITPLYANTANGGEVLPWSPIPWFCSISGEGLGATTGTGSTTGILVVYGKE
jgi:hypothetical protein